MEYIEVSGKTKDDAIMKASMQLETPSDELDIQVVSEGSRGFLGLLGSKPFVIRAGKKKEFVEEKIEKIEADEGKQEEDILRTETLHIEQKRTDSMERAGGAAAMQRNRSRGGYRRREPRHIEVITDEGQIAEIEKKAKEFLSSVFDAMKLDAQIHVVYSKRDGSLAIDFAGEDMGILIGKRGQTLDSLQYLTGLVINKGKNSYVKVKMDTENYRARRKETLENLARGIASKVRKTRKAVVLEPMNPYERRIIHSALQGNHYVETVSEGVEPYRHIVVKPSTSLRKYQQVR